MPVLAIAGDRDLICPPEAVFGIVSVNMAFCLLICTNLEGLFLLFVAVMSSCAETVKLFPKNLVSYKVFGEPSGPHYAHYDLVGGPEVGTDILD